MKFIHTLLEILLGKNNQQKSKTPVQFKELKEMQPLVQNHNTPSNNDNNGTGKDLGHRHHS